MKIVLCSSAAFYKHVNEIQDQLSDMGFEAVVPESATKMRASGDYDVSHNKTWYQNKDDYHIKRRLMGGHFKAVEEGDAILIVNDEKHGVPGYIGPNVLMEMALAYYLKKPIYILNEVSEEASVYEEVMGMGANVINGDLAKIKS